MPDAPDPAAKPPREARVDLLRGFSLLTIFADHIPGNDLSAITLRNFGFSDAAELFVLLAGFASMAAYGRSFSREGIVPGLRRIVVRCVRLYFYQAGMILVTLGILHVWSRSFGLAPLGMEPIMDGGLRAIRQSLMMESLPAYLDILPLYIVLLACFPLIYAGMRRSAAATFVVSALVWGAAHLAWSPHLINAIDHQPWFFNPFAWQFLFTIGAVLYVAMTRSGGSLPRHGWLVALCWAYLAVAFLETAPWHDWGLPDLSPIDMAEPDKTNLSPLRLLHVLALVYVALTSDWLLRAPNHVLGRAFVACGRHSLEVFSAGTLLSMVGRLVFRTWGFSWPMQLVVNGGGIVLLVGLGMGLDALKVRPSRPVGPPEPAAPAERASA